MRHLLSSGRLFRNINKIQKIVNPQSVFCWPERCTVRNLSSTGFSGKDVYRYVRTFACHRISINDVPLSKKLHNPLKYSTSPDEELSLSNERVQHYLSILKNKFDSCSSSANDEDQITARSLKPLMNLLEEVDKIQLDIKDLSSMVNDPESDKEMRQLAQADIEDSMNKLKDIEESVLNSLVPVEPMEDTDILLEISAGVGGQEAMLFCQELFNMYLAYADYMGWETEVTDYETTDIGGLRHAVAVVRGEGAYRLLKYEGGIHRVQRVPKTEKSGRIHTSTVSVAVMPQPSEIDIQILEKDLKIETKRASGAGGQHVNTTDSAVRVVHIPTGIAVESQKERSQHRNKDECMKKLRVHLYQVQLDENMSRYTSNRKLQVGTKARSEKIRTYNYPQDRVTDHRIGISVHNLQLVLNGTEDLHSLVCQLLEEGWKERLWDTINNPEFSPYS